LIDGWKNKYIEMFGSFTEPFNCHFVTWQHCIEEIAKQCALLTGLDCRCICVVSFVSSWSSRRSWFWYISSN